MVFLTELAANASDHGVRVVIYSGNDDALVSHRGSEGELNAIARHYTLSLTLCSRHPDKSPRQGVASTDA